MKIWFHPECASYWVRNNIFHCDFVLNILQIQPTTTTEVLGDKVTLITETPLIISSTTKSPAITSTPTTKSQAVTSTSTTKAPVVTTTSSTEIITTITPSGGYIFSCPLPSGLFRHPTICSKFYECSNNIAYEMDCAAPLFFNIAIGVCDWPENVACSSTDAPSSGYFACPLPSGLFRHPTICSKFYECSNNIAYEMDCAAPLFFNIAIGVCDWPENVACYY